MTTADLVYEHLKQLPEPTLGTVLDFVQFLEQKERQSGRTGGSKVTDGPRQPGSARGQVWMAPDFDAPLEDFKEFNHRDPFDRLLIAQAIVLGCPLLSADPLFSAYPVECIWK